MNNRQERLFFFLVVWFTMISFLAGWGQNINVFNSQKDFLNLSYPGRPIKKSKQDLPLNDYQVDRFSTSEKSEGIRVYINKKQSADYVFRPNIPSNIYYVQSGFICKKEWEIEKSTHIPFRFRVGSLADCNAMEGKH